MLRVGLLFRPMSCMNQRRTLRKRLRAPLRRTPTLSASRGIYMARFGRQAKPVLSPPGPTPLTTSTADAAAAAGFGGPVKGFNWKKAKLLGAAGASHDNTQCDPCPLCSWCLFVYLSPRAVGVCVCACMYDCFFVCVCVCACVCVCVLRPSGNAWTAPTTSASPQQPQRAVRPQSGFHDSAAGQHKALSEWDTGFRGKVWTRVKDLMGKLKKRHPAIQANMLSVSLFFRRASSRAVVVFCPRHLLLVCWPYAIVAGGGGFLCVVV